MRPAPVTYRAALAATHPVLTQVSVYRAGALLADRVPVTEGTITYDDTATLRRRLTLTVPQYDPMTGRSWDPADNPNHPLANYGQTLRVRTGISLPDGTAALFDHGYYLITDWAREETERTVQVTAVDVAQLLVDARHYTTESPARNTTYAQEFTRLVNGILPVRIDPALPATKINSATVWDRERTKNLDDLCDAWGARWYVGDDGAVHAAPAYKPVTNTTPHVARFTGGTRGTVVTRSRSGTRDRLYNAVIVTGKTNDTSGGTTTVAPYGIAEITDPASPIRVNGPYGRKPRFYSSEMLTTAAQCRAAASTMLTAASSISRTEPIAAIPDPALELGDVAEVVTNGLAWKGRVQSITLPLTAEGGSMAVVLANKPADDDEDGARTVTQTDAGRDAP